MTLFDEPEKPVHWTDRLANEAVARRTDPGTSWAAARSVRGLRESQADVLSLFVRFGPMHDEALIAQHRASTLKPQSVSGLRTRRKELTEVGVLVDTGQKVKTAAGRQSIVWGIA